MTIKDICYYTDVFVGVSFSVCAGLWMAMNAINSAWDLLGFSRLVVEFTWYRKEFKKWLKEERKQ